MSGPAEAVLLGGEDGGATGPALTRHRRPPASDGDQETWERVFASPQMQRLRRSVKQNVPVYVHHRVYEGLRDVLLSGAVASGDRLPTPGQLAQFLHVGHPTVRRALRRLLEEGIVVSEPELGLVRAHC